MSVLDFYRIVSDDAIIDIYGKDEDINYFYGKAPDIPVKYLEMVVRHLTASYNPDTNSIDYMLWVWYIKHEVYQ